MPPGSSRFEMRPAEGVKRLGVFGVDAAFDGVAADLDFFGNNRRQMLAVGEQNLALHQIDAGD